MNITLKWEQCRYRDNDREVISKNSIEAGNYRISKQYLSGDPIYTAWVRGTPWKSLEVFQGKDGLNRAKAACELHYMENMK